MPVDFGHRHVLTTASDKPCGTRGSGIDFPSPGTDKNMGRGRDMHGRTHACVCAHTTHTLKWPRLPQKWRRFYER